MIFQSGAHMRVWQREHGEHRQNQMSMACPRLSIMAPASTSDYQCGRTTRRSQQ
jgi:hypothetical protein